MKKSKKVVLGGIMALAMGGLGWSIYSNLEKPEQMVVKKTMLKKITTKIKEKM